MLHAVFDKLVHPPAHVVHRPHPGRLEVLLARLDEVADAAVDDPAHHVVPGDALSAKVILSGKLTKKVSLKGVGATKGAKAAIEAAGGSVATE